MCRRASPTCGPSSTVQPTRRWWKSCDATTWTTSWSRPRLASTSSSARSCTAACGPCPRLSRRTPPEGGTPSSRWTRGDSTDRGRVGPRGRGRSRTALRGSLGAALRDHTLHLLDVLFGLCLALQPRGRHVAHLAEDGTLGPSAVVLAVDPGDVGEGVGVAPVHEVLVVEVERGPVGVLRGVGPLQDLLTPVHAHVVVHVAGVHHLPHGSVPVRVVGLR